MHLMPPFNITLEIEIIEGEHYLVAAMELDSNSYIISPFSQDSVYSHFDISINKRDKIILDNTLLEVPNSIKEYDPILEEEVNFVRVNTIYKQKLQLIYKGDFQVEGMIEFLLEPSCIPYDVEFAISYQSGKLRVMKTKMTISKEYKL